MYLYCLVLFCLCVSYTACKKFSERSLIFPPTSPTRTQLIIGIGIPLDLDTESLTTGYVLKAEYFLPTTAEELRPTQVKPQSVRFKRNINTNNTSTTNGNELNVPSLDLDLVLEKKIVTKSRKKLSIYRWAIYKGIETIIDRAGQVGRACMLRSICEAAETPFHYHSGILGEFLHILMSPSSSVDPVFKHSDNEYFHAEKLGKYGAPCELIFKECKNSLLEKFSGVYAFSQQLLKFLLLIDASRIKRFLIFPPSAPTRHQFIAGIGIPADLEDQSVTTGYVFKAQFYLPINSSTFRTRPIIPEFKQTRSSDIYNQTESFSQWDFLKSIRWYTYFTLENLITSFGNNGNHCVLKLICESAGSFKNSMTLLEEIFNIILTPSSTSEQIDSETKYQYGYAERLGKSGQNCSEKYKSCNISILNQISLLFS